MGKREGWRERVQGGMDETFTPFLPPLEAPPGEQSSFKVDRKSRQVCIVSLSHCTPPLIVGVVFKNRLSMSGPAEPPAEAEETGALEATNWARFAVFHFVAVPREELESRPDESSEALRKESRMTCPALVPLGVLLDAGRDDAYRDSRVLSDSEAFAAPKSPRICSNDIFWKLIG
jgi:hypothetical protein